MNVESSSEHLILVDIEFSDFWLQTLGQITQFEMLRSPQKTPEETQENTGLIWNIWEAGGVSRSLQLKKQFI